MVSLMRALTILAVISACSTSPAFAVEFGIFGDVSVGDSNTSEASFALGHLDFFGAASVDDKSRVFIEVVLENDGHGLITDLERLWISRDVRPGVTVGAGRFHTPLGHWNRSYHHGSFVQDTISRPIFLDFEDGAGGVLPVHIVGLLMWGDRQFGSGRVEYEFAAGNGSNLDTDDFGFASTAEARPEIEINDVGDANNNKSIVGRVRFVAAELPIQAAVFMLAQDVAEAGAGTLSGGKYGDILVEQTIYGTDFQLALGGFALTGEVFAFRHQGGVTNRPDSNGLAYFVQMEQQAAGRLKLVARYEHLSFDATDVWFSLLGAAETRKFLIGARYDLSDTTSIKFEMSDQETNRRHNRAWRVQWTFFIP